MKYLIIFPIFLSIAYSLLVFPDEITIRAPDYINYVKVYVGVFDEEECKYSYKEFSINRSVEYLVFMNKTIKIKWLLNNNLEIDDASTKFFECKVNMNISKIEELLEIPKVKINQKSFLENLFDFFKVYYMFLIPLFAIPIYFFLKRYIL